MAKKADAKPTAEKPRRRASVPLRLKTIFLGDTLEQLAKVTGLISIANW